MNRNPSFFKILLGDLASRLSLPPYFARLHRNDLQKKSKLRAGSGDTWDVKIEQNEGKLCFTKGWTKFVRDANLELGEFVVFWFDSNESTFDVAAYGIHCSENAIRGGSLGSGSIHVDSDDDVEILEGDQQQDDMNDENLMDDDHSGAESDAEFGNSSGPKFNIELKSCHRSRMRISKSFAEKAGLVGKEAVIVEYVPTQQCSIVTVVDKSKTSTFRLELASGWNRFWNENELAIGKTYSFVFNQARNVYQVQPDDYAKDHSSPCNLNTPCSSSKIKTDCTKRPGTIDRKASKPYQEATAYWKNTNQHLSFKSSMRRSYFNTLTMPKSIIIKQLPKPKNEIKLRVSSRKIWPVTCVYSKTNAQLQYAGWNVFLADNNIKVGDAFVFEMNESDKSIWNVTIFRS